MLGLTRDAKTPHSEQKNISETLTPVMSSIKYNNESSGSQITILDSLQTSDLQDLQALLERQELRKQELIKRRNSLRASSKAESEEMITRINSEVGIYSEKLTTLKKQFNKESEEKLPQKLENPEIYFKLDKLKALEKSSDYLHVVAYIRTTSERICELLKTGETPSALDIFSFLHQIQTVHVHGSQCLALIDYCSSVVSHWEKDFAIRLSKDFENALEKIGWPLRIIQATPTEEEKQVFQKCATSIIRFSKLVPQPDTPRGNKMSTILADYKDPVLPIQIMVKPLKKRFRFNFFGSNSTSKESKPDWYFSQVKYWIRDLVPFLKTNVEPLSMSLIKISSIVELIRALSELLIIKADVELSNCMESVDNLTFAKILEESIIYENEVGQVLRESLASKIYIPPFVSTLFSQTDVLKRWLSIEQNACQEKMDDIFSSPSAWDRAVVPGPPEIVHLFLVLLRFITGRFSHLPQPGQRLQFLQLLVNMIDDFRYRCLQIWRSRDGSVEDVTSNMLFDYVMADALWHVQVSLETWEDLPLFESLSFFLENIQEAEEKQLRLAGIEAHCEIGFRRAESLIEQSDEFVGTSKQASIGTPNRGLFSKVQELYTCLGEEILTKWLSCVMDDIGESITNSYISKKWHSLPDPSADGELGISKEFFLPLQKISCLCKAVEHGMTFEVAQKWLKRLAVTLDNLFMRKLLTSTRLSNGAIQQLRYDFVHGLFPIFSSSSVQIPIFFTGIACAVKIWDMAVGDAMLILDDLTSEEVSGNLQEEILAELEITLTPTEVLRLLNTRTDIKPIVL